MNRKGFTLVELLAVLVILGLIVSIGGVAITKIMSNTKEKNYETLVANVSNAVETYYQECNYGGLYTCESPVKVSTLTDYGFINYNYTTADGNKYLIDPRDEGKDSGKMRKICTVNYSYSGNKLTISSINWKEGLTTGC